MCDPRINQWHILFSGFLQTEGEPVGMVRLWHAMHLAFAGPRICVLLREYDSDIDSLSEVIWRYSWNDDPAKIGLYGYSFGGTTAVKMARRLKHRGLAVDRLVLSDPVYRHWHYLGAWRALWPRSVIRVPDNVAQVNWWRQRNDWPRGHDLVAEDPAKTTIHNPFFSGVGHKYMDDLPDFHAFCLQNELDAKRS